MWKFYGQRACTLNIKEYIPDTYNNITYTTTATMLTKEDYLSKTYTIMRLSMLQLETLVMWVTNQNSRNSWCQIARRPICYKQKIIQFIRRNQVYFSSSNVSTDTTVIVKDYMLSEKFTFCFKITIKWNLTKSHATRIK